jgi:ADP-ribose pyrophosphatase YjhB (NUDIX family)
MTEIRKRVSVGALIRDQQGKILIVKPGYKEGWLFVGGMVEDLETPTEALQREIKEEVGLDLEIGRLLCVDFGPKEKGSIILIFDCGTVKSDEKISYTDNEIINHKFVTQEKAMKLLRPKGAHRLSFVLKGLEKDTVSYLEDNSNIK